MRDFKAFVRPYVEPLALPRRREVEIVDELAAQLADAYEALLARGFSDDEAWNELQRHGTDWTALGAELLDAEPAIIRLAQPERRWPAGAGRALGSAIRSLLGLGFAGDLRSSARLLVKHFGF
jgi:hypothetical protein